MGVYTRDYMQRPTEEALRDQLGAAVKGEDYEEAARLRDLLRASGGSVDDEEVPSWELIADELRIRLIATIKAAPITCIGDIAMLCDCATSVFRLHCAGQEVDAKDEAPTEEEGE